MLRGLVHNHQLQRGIVALTALFLALWWTMPPDLLMSILNGVFIGTVVTVVAAYYRLIVRAVRGEGGPFDRVQQMTLGLLLLWISIVIGVGVSIYARSTEAYTATYTAVAASRYIAIIAAGLQIKSLDYGFGLFHGRDKRMLWASVLLGVVVGATAIGLQQL